MGTPEDAAQLIAWLCSPAAAWVTGQTIVSDGGYSLV
jgi:3-oxoacyl-[acyl-carrier protein] reductase